MIFVATKKIEQLIFPPPLFSLLLDPGSGIRDAVLRIRDVYPGSRILIFTHPGSRISDTGSKNSTKREG